MLSPIQDIAGIIVWVAYRVFKRGEAPLFDFIPLTPLNKGGIRGAKLLPEASFLG